MRKDIIIDDFKKILKENGLKNTLTRKSILEIFLNNNLPISAEYIFNKLKGNIDEATVYRTLASFEEKKILKRVNLRKNSTHFELNNDHHHHIICTKCGLIEDFKEVPEVENILRRVVEKSSKFKNIYEHSLELFGICRVCN